MARILGLDLGSYAVKGVVLDATMRTSAVKGYASARRPDGPDPTEALRAAVTELLARQPVVPDQVLISLPGPTLATHSLSLPFTDAKRLDATLPFEIESQLPFDLAEAVYDYQVAVQRDKKSELIVGVVRKEEMRALLDALAPLQLDPRIVTHPALAYGYLFSLAPALFGRTSPGEAVAIVDVGHERTTVAIGEVSGPVEFARTFSGAGKELTRALATEFKIGLPDAAAWKEAHGALGSQVVGADAERAAGALLRGLQPVLRELRQSFKSYWARTHRPIAKLYLCGGTSRLPGLEEQLTRDLGIPAEVLKVPDLPGAAAQAAPEAVQAYALGLGGQASGAKAMRFNLRRGEFGFKGHFDYLRERLGRLAAFSAALILLLIASGVVRNSLLSRREQAVDAVLCDITQRVLGTCQKDFNLALNLLKGKESPTAAVPKLSAVGLLSELTNRLPTDVPITFDQLEVTLDRMTVRIETDGPKSIDRITAALKTYKCFKEIREGKVEKSKDGTKVNLRLDIEIECPEDTRT